jgi:1-acyl-sn-glycerol-3-phosphate acyltransferase
MLEAKKSRIFDKIFALYNRNLLRRRFHSFRVSGLNFLEEKTELPLLIYANHSSWWDGLIFFEISRRAGLNSFVMMEEKHLRKLFLFRRLGAFSVVREKPREAARSVDYAAKILREERRAALLIFPQGEILPNDARPMTFYNGAARTVEKAGELRAVACAMRYEFLGEFKPEIFVRIGEPEIIKPDENFDAKKLTKNFEKRLTETLDALKNDISKSRFDEFEGVF